MRFFGKEKQDRFAYYLIGEKGTFLDIGCYHPTQWNNTMALEQAGWTGLLFDIKEEWIALCSKVRKSKAFCVDVSTDEFADILNDNVDNKSIDYISLDADDGSLGALQQLLKNGYTFKCMTFEHDYYDRGNTLKAPSKILLQEWGYQPLFEDVKLKDGKIWEDWWVDPKQFPKELIDISCVGEYYENCVLKVMEFMNDHRE